MSLNKAIFEMKPGDIFDPKSAIYSVLKMTGGKAMINIADGTPVSLSAGNLGIVGKIIPIDPKVLTYHEWNKRWNEKYRSEKPGYHQVYEAGDKNGQLKEWLNHKELREAAKEALKMSPAPIGSPHAKLNHTLKNLKPLNK